MKSIHSHHIVTETEVVDGWLTIDDEGRIAAIGDTPVGTRIEEVQDDWLLPGLIDPHLHGFMGWNASKQPMKRRSSTWPMHCCGRE